MEKRTNSTDNAATRGLTGKFPGLAVLFTLLLLFAFALPSPAWAISFQKAKGIAIAELKPESEKGSVIVFGLPAPLKPTQSVVEAGSAKADAVPFIQKGKPLKKKAWLFWEDLAPYAHYQHPSRLLLVDDKTGKILKKQDYLWYPLVDGKSPGFLKSTKAYESSTYRIYSSFTKDSSKSLEEPERAVQANQLPQEAFKDDCLISIGLRNDPLFSGDFTGMSQFARSVGLTAFDAANGADKNVGGAALATNVNYMVETTKCKDIFIFMSGHGYRAGTPAIQTGVSGPGERAITVTSSNLGSILDSHPDTTFKFKINGCFSGRFVPELKDKENLLVIETAANSTEYSYGRLRQNRYSMDDGTVVNVDTSRVNPGRSEFVNGNLAGMKTFVDSSAEISDAQALGGSLLARMIGRGFTLGASSDAARAAGMTHPVLHSNLDNFTVTTSLDYQHFTLYGYSEVCVLFGTAPAQEGATYTVSISGPGVAGPSPVTGTLPSIGATSATFKIDSYGTYTVAVTVTSADGTTATTSGTVVVTDAPGKGTCS